MMYLIRLESLTTHPMYLCPSIEFREAVLTSPDMWFRLMCRGRVGGSIGAPVRVGSCEDRNFFNTVTDSTKFTATGFEIQNIVTL